MFVPRSTNRFSLIKYVFQGDSQDQLTAACNARCREEFAASGKQQGICLMACSKPTREVCVATCGRFIGDNAATGLTAPEATQCGRACSLLCSTEPRPELADLSCCVSPPLVCGGKGTREAQVFLNDWICGNVHCTVLYSVQYCPAILTDLRPCVHTGHLECRSLFFRGTNPSYGYNMFCRCQMVRCFVLVY